MSTNKCPVCDGDGCTVEHDPNDPTGQTPIQVRCDFCHAEGKITTLDCVREALQAQRDAKDREAITENTSDGYHTFKELYEFRLLYNAVLFNEWSQHGKYAVHKSTKHSDGEDCFGGGWFIVVATLPTGDISNHYEMKDWNLFICETRVKGKEWDGHTSKDVALRLRELVKAEEAVVGDWEAELEGFIEALFDKHGESYEVYNPVAFTADIGKFITSLLAAKDREIAEAYKKGLIDGGLSK